MIVRVRDLVAALLLFPLALSGFFLGFGIAVFLSELFGSSGGNSAATAGANHGGSDLTTWIILLICLAIPATYFFFIRRTMRAHPHHLFFGELSSQVFLVLAITTFGFPLLAALILMLLVF